MFFIKTRQAGIMLGIRLINQRFPRLYSKDTKVFYVHGNMNEIENGIVLGINADQKD